MAWWFHAERADNSPLTADRVADRSPLAADRSPLGSPERLNR